VRVETWTHKLGELHQNDFIVAAKADQSDLRGDEARRILKAPILTAIGRESRSKPGRGARDARCPVPLSRPAM
jgi:hypothetical protein